MSRKANCWDNSPSESFFATLKKELGSIFISFEASQVALEKYIDWYNTTRRHSFNSGKSPIEKELAAYTRMAASMWPPKADQVQGASTTSAVRNSTSLAASFTWQASIGLLVRIHQLISSGESSAHQWGDALAPKADCVP